MRFRFASSLTPAGLMTPPLLSTSNDPTHFSLPRIMKWTWGRVLILPDGKRVPSCLQHNLHSLSPVYIYAPTVALSANA